MKVKVDFDTDRILKEKQARLNKAQFLLDQQVLKDSNFYAPRDEGSLVKSGIIGTAGGTVEWDIVYAKRQYYEYPNKSKDKNINAQMKWFEVAKSKKKKEWIKIANGEYNK
jgi:hypothetical protein